MYAFPLTELRQYQLGLALSFNKNFEESIDSFRGAVKVIEERIGKEVAIKVTWRPVGHVHST